MEVAQESLDEVNDDTELLKRVITGEETWVYGCDVETESIVRVEALRIAKI